MKYLAICTETKHGRSGFITGYTARNEVSVTRWVNGLTGLVGYVGGCSMREAIKRSGMMERNEANAWGVIGG